MNDLLGNWTEKRNTTWIQKIIEGRIKERIKERIPERIKERIKEMFLDFIK